MIARLRIRHRCHCPRCTAWLVLRGVVALSVSIAVLAAVRDARAAPKRSAGAATEGMLVHVQGAEHVIDIGRKHGLRAGNRVRLYRTIRVRHPVSGRKLRDRFEVGEVEISEVAARMAVLIVPPKMARRLRPGDPVQVLRPKPRPQPKPAPAAARSPVITVPAAVLPPAARRPGAPLLNPTSLRPGQLAPDPVEQAAERQFRATLGKQPAERITAWRRFLAEHPDSPLAAGIRAEIDTMAELGADQRRLQQGDSTRRRLEHARRIVRHQPLPAMRVGEPAWVVITAADWSSVADARVYYKRTGAGVFRMARAEPAGRLHRRVRLPDDAVRSPGFQYFAVVTDTGGGIRHLAGDASRPRTVAVNDAHATIGRPRKDATTLRWITEYVDFNRMRGDDRVLISELSVAYRLNHGRLHAFDMGYGFLNGRGGRVADGGEALVGGKVASRGDTLDGRAASFKYAWLGTDWAFSPAWHGIVRLVMGLDGEGLDTGIELLTRIGAEKGTHLQLGMSALADTGRAASVALTTHVVPKVPMTGVFEVTNRPVGEDLGIRLVYQADFEVTEALALTGRASYALRTIDHAGFGLGAGLALNW